MIFLHYADDHPLFAYAFFSPKTKRIVHRQDVIFLPSVFSIRSAHLESGLCPEGEALVSYRSPPSVSQSTPDELSFHGWAAQDPLPDFEDEISSFDLELPVPDLDEGLLLGGHEDPSCCDMHYNSFCVPILLVSITRLPITNLYQHVLHFAHYGTRIPTSCNPTIQHP